MNHTGTVELATQRLTLRRFEPDDAENMFYNWASDPEVVKYLTWPPHKDAGESREVIRNWMQRYADVIFYEWAIELNDLEQPIGSISAVMVDDRSESIEIGYCIGKKFWGKGYTSEALAEVLRFFLEEVGAGRVWACHDIRNPKSGKVMEKCGMEYEGTLHRAGRNNLGIHDVAVYAKIGSVAEQEDEEEILQAAATVDKVMGKDGIMRNVISDETMEYVGILAKLELSKEEAKAARKDMEDMLDYIDKLNELDTSKVEPMSHIFPVQNVFREDYAAGGDGSAAALANAPEQKNGGFKVPKTIGDC